MDDDMDMLLSDAAEMDASPIDLPAVIAGWWITGVGCDDLDDAIRSEALPVRRVMSGWEEYVFDRLPEVLTVYRGTTEGAAPGAFWTLSRRIAASYWPWVDTLLTGRVLKTDVIALKLYGPQCEIISLQVEEVAREPV